MIMSTTTSVVPAGYPTDAGGVFKLLGTRTRLSTDDMKVLALIEHAGEGAYFAMAAAVDNEEAKALLSRNAQEERGHAFRLIKAIKLLGDSFELPADTDNPYYSTRKYDALTGDFLSMIVAGEQDGDLQYQTWADAEPNAEVAKILRQNGSEESRHGERVMQVKALLQ
jgi:rubrerythrin